MNDAPLFELIQKQAAIEAVLHFCCRDRNLLALVADAGALGDAGICRLAAASLLERVTGPASGCVNGGPMS